MPPEIPHSKELKEKILGFLKDHTLDRAAEEFNLSRSTIASWKKQQFKKPAAYLGLNNEEKFAYKKEVLIFYQNNSLQATAEKYGVQPNDIYRYGRQLNFSKKLGFIDIPSNLENEDEDVSLISKEEIVNYYKTHTFKETCEKFKISKRTLQRYAEELGYEKFVARPIKQPEYHTIPIDKPEPISETPKKSKIAVIIADDVNSAIDVLKGLF